jgi:tetratricopeptide (TPR) repeat protein
VRLILTFGCILLLWHIVARLPSEPPQSNRTETLGEPSVEAILREASELALKQESHQDLWNEALSKIVELQIRAGDFEGAFRSTDGSKNFRYRNKCLVHIAEALALSGDKERAFDIVRLVDSDWRPDAWDIVRPPGWISPAESDWQPEDEIQLCWIEHLIASFDLDAAAKAFEQLKSKQNRLEGLRKLAVAYGTSGDPAWAAKLFKLAVNAAVLLNNEFDRLFALQKIADAQLSTGKPDDAITTIRLLVDKTELKVSWARFLALRESAVLAANANDRETAIRLFQRAIDTHREVGETNGNWKLETVAVAQAGVGYVDEARNTGLMIKPSGDHPQYDFASRNIRCAVAMSQLKSGDAEGAIHSALSIDHDVELRDKTLQKIVDHLIAQRQLKKALSIAEKIEIESRKATARLNVATALVKAGDRKTAAAVAARIDLAGTDFGNGGRDIRFNYRSPLSWGNLYGLGGISSAGIYSRCIQSAAKVAAAAMTFSQALGLEPAQSYGVLFNSIDAGEIVQALARAHAASGDANEALAWAEQIGSDAAINANSDDKVFRAVNRRICALIGVAEGILDRTNDPAKVIASGYPFP